MHVGESSLEILVTEIFFASKKSSVCKLALDSVVVIVASNKEESSNLHPLIF